MEQTISKLAAELGVRSDTIRYYERIGLMPQPRRTASNYRLYGSDSAQRIRFIKSAQRLGLRLGDIREMLEIKDNGMCPCGHTSALLSKRIEALDKEIAELNALRDELSTMLKATPAPAGEDSLEGSPAPAWYCDGELIKPEGLCAWLCSEGGENL